MEGGPPDPNGNSEQVPKVNKFKKALKKNIEFNPTAAFVPDKPAVPVQRPTPGPPEPDYFVPGGMRAPQMMAPPQPDEYMSVMHQYQKMGGNIGQPGSMMPGMPMQKAAYFKQMEMHMPPPYPMMDLDESYSVVIEHIYNLRFPERREEALTELSKKRETFKYLAPIMWHSFGTIAILLQELVNAYPYLSPPNLSTNISSKVCSVLGLFQCLALHQETRSSFLAAHLPLFLYPFLYTQSKSKPFENLRVSSLGVIGALVKGDDQQVINFLLQTEIIPLCLRIMKKGQELSKTVATFIVQKILNDERGLVYICQTVERLFAVSLVLKNMTEELFKSGKDEQKLLRHIIRCYLRLLEFKQNGVWEHISSEMPDVLKDPGQKLLQDESVAKLHAELMQKISSKLL